MLRQFLSVVLLFALHELVSCDVEILNTIHSRLIGRHLKNNDVTTPVYDMIARVLARGGVEVNFKPTLEIIGFEDVDGTAIDVFEVDKDENGVVLRGSSAVALSTAFGYYLKYYTYCDFHWENGGNYSFSAFPKSMKDIPIPQEKERVVFLSKLRYYMNTCTESYSFAWKDWKSWEQEIDWMAMNGYNLPLAFTGQELVWQKLWIDYGVSEPGLQEYFTGPAFLTWQRMANIRAFGGPLPQSWIDKQADLQRSILQRFQEFGMTPVMPAFNGVVPKEMATLYPNSNITRLTPTWNSFPDADCCNYIIPSTDPLFIEVGSKYLQLQEQLFGSYAMSHIYNCDTFNENKPASSDSVYLSSSSAAVYNSMKAVDPDAIWLMQGWLFINDAEFWTDDSIKYYLSGVPDDGMIILDLSSEDLPVWDKISANRKQFIWCMLHNYGGRRAIYGNIPLLSTDIISTNDAVPQYFQGTGMTMESIDQNPIQYEFMSEMSIHRTVPNVTAWTDSYVIRRYGLYEDNDSKKRVEYAHKAWSLLLANSYSGDAPVCHHPCHRESIISLKPGFTLTQSTGINSTILATVWHLLQFVEQPHVTAYTYDLVDIARQVMSNLFYDVYALYLHNTQRYDIANTLRIGAKMLELIADWDVLLSSHESYLLGPWIRDARAWASSEEEADLYEFNARNIITLWGASGEIDDYAAKCWGGLVKGYYLPRWELFLNMSATAVLKHQSFPTDAYSSAELTIGQSFSVDYNTTFATAAKGNTMEISEALQHKYGLLYTSANKYEKQTGFDSKVNLMNAPMWTKDVRQLKLLCDLDDHCQGFTSVGLLKKDTSATAVFEHEGVDLYIKQ